ncbi:MAG: ABC transporter permease [Candidatus Verstraetearchaeota archaeon]|nr:ABC transporter permease [Candidatus Verstraetearchaeota archaeon]
MSESILSITLRSLYVSSTAALIAFTLAIALSAILARAPRKRAEMVLGVFEALVGVPTTVIGLFVYMLLYPHGPLGFMKLLYTPIAIVIGQFLVALPMAFTSMFRSFYELKEGVRELVLSLGCSEKHATKVLLRELAPVLTSSYLLAFSRAIGELGVALIVGGGIEGYTSVLTTAIAVRTSIGDYELAIQIGLILLCITTSLALILKAFGERVLWR